MGLCSDPAPVVSNEGILVFHEDKDNHGDLWVTSRSGGLGAIYSEDTRIDTEVMTGSPGAVAVDNAVYVFLSATRQVRILACRPAFHRSCQHNQWRFRIDRDHR